jgi:paraquat-inducible protein B
VLNFDQSVRGLTPGAPVDFRGVIVGQVRSIGIEYQRDKKAFRMPVVVEFYPSRMGFRERDVWTSAQAHHRAGAGQARHARAVAHRQPADRPALRGARLLPEGAAAEGPRPQRADAELPTTPGTFDELQAKLGDIVSKIDKVPFDQIGQDVPPWCR